MPVLSLRQFIPPGRYPPQQHRAELRQKEAKHDEARKERNQTVKDPLEPALRHGHQPSRGAQIDADLQKEDEQQLQEKGGYFGVNHDKRQDLRPEKMERKAGKAEMLQDPVEE